MDVIHDLKKRHINLTNEEIVSLFKDIDKNKDLIARSQFALIIKMVKKFKYIIKEDEIVSLCLLSLSKSINTYDISKDDKCDFSVYVYVIMFQEINKDIKSNRIIRLPNDKIYYERGKHVKAIPATDLLIINTDGEYTEFFDNYIDEVEEYDENPNRTQKLFNIIDKVFKGKELHKEVLLTYYKLNGDVKTKDLPIKYNVSKQYINQIKFKALDMLKKDKTFNYFIKENYE